MMLGTPMNMCVTATFFVNYLCFKIGENWPKTGFLEFVEKFGH